MAPLLFIQRNHIEARKKVVSIRINLENATGFIFLDEWIFPSEKCNPKTCSFGLRAMRLFSVKQKYLAGSICGNLWISERLLLNFLHADLMDDTKNAWLLTMRYLYRVYFVLFTAFKDEMKKFR